MFLIILSREIHVGERAGTSISLSINLKSYKYIFIWKNVHLRLCIYKEVSWAEQPQCLIVCGFVCVYVYVLTQTFMSVFYCELRKWTLICIYMETDCWECGSEGGNDRSMSCSCNSSTLALLHHLKLNTTPLFSSALSYSPTPPTHPVLFHG